MPSNQGFKMNVKHEEIADAIKQGKGIVRQEVEILKHLELIGSQLDPQDVKHEEIADAIKQGRDRVKGNQEILEYLGYIGVRGQNG